MTGNIYIALLRGVNVSGRNLLKMQELRKCLDKIGFKNTRTYVQSGNIIFQSEILSSVTLAQMISESISRDFGLEVPVLVKTLSEIIAAIEENPFLPDQAENPESLYLTLLERKPEETQLEFIPDQSGPDRFIIINDRIYLYCPGGYGKTKFTNTFFEKKLKTIATTRNWNTLLQLHAMGRTTL